MNGVTVSYYKNPNDIPSTIRKQCYSLNYQISGDMQYYFKNGINGDIPVMKCAIIIDRNGKVLSWAMAYQDNCEYQEGYEIMVYTRKCERRKGYGSLAVNTLKNRIKKPMKCYLSANYEFFNHVFRNPQSI